MKTDPLKVLAIDDNPHDLFALEEALRGALPSAALVTALDGLHGIELALAEDPDVIVLDVMMPGMNGYEVCERLKADERLREIPVVFVTGLQAARGARIRALDVGAEAFLSKPVDEVELTAQIRAMAKIKAANVQARREQARLSALVVERTAERRRAEEARRESESKYKAVFENAPIGISLLDQKRNMIESNAALERITRITRDGLLVGAYRGRKYIRPDGTEMPPAELASVRARNENRPVHDVETGILTEDGQIIWTQVSAAPLGTSASRIVVITQDITERKQVAEKLRESEDKFRYFFDNSIVAKAITLPSEEITANQAFADMLGYTPAELKSLKWQEFTHPDDLDLIQSEVDALLSGESESRRVALRYMRRDGSVVWTDTSIFLRRDREGKPLYFMTTLNDITARVHAEIALRQERDRAQRYLDIAGVILMAFDAAGKVVLINQRGIDVLGCRQEEIIDKSWFDTYLPARTRDQVKTVFEELMSGEVEAAEYSENPVLTRCGEERMIAWHNALLKDDAGRVISILSSGEDITERKRAETALRESEERFRTIAEQMADMIYLTDGEGVISYVSLAAEQLFGVTPAEMQGRLFTDFVVASDIPKAVAAFRAAIASGTASQNLELRMRRGDGSEFTGELSGALYRTDRLRGVIGLIRDVTERKRAETALRESEANFRRITEQMTDVVFLTDATGVLQYVSPAAESLLGVPSAAMQGRRFTDFLVATEISSAVGALEALMATGVALKNLEFQVLRSDGSVFTGELGATRYVTDTQQGTIGLIRDVTERKWAADALMTRANQQAAVSELGQIALAATDLQRLLDRAVTRVAETFGVEYCKVLELLPDDSALKLVAGVGWQPGLVGTATVGVGEDTQAGYTLVAHEPVIVEDMRVEARFSGPSMLHEHGVISGISVVIQGQDRPYGVISAHSAQQRVFSSDDAQFLQSVANVLAEAIQRRRAEEALHESEERFRAVVETAPDAIFIQTQGCFAYLNPAAVALFGVADGSSLVGRPVLDRFHPDCRETVAERIQQLNQGRIGVSRVAERILRSDGTAVDVEVSAVPFAYQDQRGGLVFAHDVTARLQAEAERGRLLAQVQAQAMQIVQIMDTVPEGVLLLEADGRVLLANQAGVRDLETLAGAAIGDRLMHLGDLPLSELLSATERSGPWREIRASQRIFEVIARPVIVGEMGAGDFTAEHWVLVINDVTQARGERDQLQQQERLAAVGQLAAGIAHDFNNVLGIIALYAPMVAQAQGLTERDRERLGIIAEQAAHATRLIQQLLDFSRRAVLERHPLDLGVLMREQVKLLTHTLPETIQVTLACEPGEYLVLADPTRLQQMTMNLAVNARDAMPRGGTLRLTLTRQEDAPRPDLSPGPWVRLEVTDSGTGIPPEALARLFEPFFTTKARGQGTGLGLAQVYGIVKQHAGEIEVHSTPGRGTTFTIYLPSVAVAAPVVAAPEAAPQMGADQTILVVEDNAALLDAMSDVVELLGYRVVRAANGVEALASLEAHGAEISLVMSDLVMPVMGGDELFDAIRARGLTVPVVILSGHPLEGELAGLKARGLAGWLLKPPKPEELARLLARALAGT